MKVRKIIVHSPSSFLRWMKSEWKRDQEDALMGKWDKESELRLYRQVGITTIERFKYSSILTDKPIGDLVENGMIDGNKCYWDNRFAHKIFGKTCVFSEGVVAVTLYIKTNTKKILSTMKKIGKVLIFKYALQKVLKEFGIETEIYSDADMYLLPSRDKFACGYGRMGKITDEETVRYEGGWFTFYYDHDLFSEILPEVELYRLNSHDPDHGAITGIKNRHPDFDLDTFINKWVEEIANLIEDNPVVEWLEDVYV